MNKNTIIAVFCTIVVAVTLLTTGGHAEEQATLAAPATAGINETFDVRVTGPDKSGDMLRFSDAEGKVLGGSYAHVGLAKEGVLRLTAPMNPGAYQIVYLSDRVVIGQTPITVTPVTATLEAPDSVRMNASFDITFQGPENSGDLVQLADTNGKRLGGLYAHAGNAREGRIALRAPVEPGNYLVVYVTGGQIIGQTPIRVETDNATVAVPASVGANETFQAIFTGPRNKGDFLQFMDEKGEPVRGHYQYVGNAADGKVQMRAPLAAGNYTVAYVTGKVTLGSAPIVIGSVSATLAMDAQVPAGAHFTVQWQGPKNNGDRLRIVDASGANAGSYGFVGQNPDGVRLRAPETVGEYRVVYLTGDVVIGETAFQVIDVTATLATAAQAEGNTRFPVNWEGPGNHGDTIQLVAEGTGDDLAYSYIQPEQGNTVTVAAPAEPGRYELRYVTHGRRVLATQPIEITPARQNPGSLQVSASRKPSLGAGDAVEVVLDASGSMLQRQDGERRIEIAKRTLGRLVTETIPEGTPFALRVFGHKEADRCRTDLEIPLAPLSPAAAGATLAGVSAMNLAKTPIAESLALTSGDLHGVTGERIIVLVTDGEETCDGDPAEVIAAMRAGGNEIRVNIVGYAIDDSALADTFSRWASLGGGEYFDAADESELGAALISSVNPSFTVSDADDVQVAAGIAGGVAISLTPGSYVVRAAGREYPVAILPGELAAVRLD